MIRIHCKKKKGILNFKREREDKAASGLSHRGHVSAESVLWPNTAVPSCSPRSKLAAARPHHLSLRIPGSLSIRVPLSTMSLHRSIGFFSQLQGCLCVPKAQR